MGRDVFESPSFTLAASKYDAKLFDEFVLFPVTWALHRRADTYPEVPNTPGWRVIKLDPEPHFQPTRIFFTIDSDHACTLEELQVGVDVYGDEDSTG